MAAHVLPHQTIVEDDLDNYLSTTHDLITVSTINESKRSAEYESYSSHRRWMDDVWKVSNPKAKIEEDVGPSSAALSSDLDVRVERIIANMFENIANQRLIDKFGQNVLPSFELLMAYEEELEKESYINAAIELSGSSEGIKAQTIHQFCPSDMHNTEVILIWFYYCS